MSVKLSIVGQLTPYTGTKIIDRAIHTFLVKCCPLQDVSGNITDCTMLKYDIY